MCDKAVEEYLCLLEYVLDWFVKQQHIDPWYDENYPYKRSEMIEWCKDYQKRKAQKLKIKEELAPIAWHPSRWWDWCVPEDEKKREKNFFCPSDMLRLKMY